jgi:anaerobic ribonucleoside-triphosphate reductase activating protein
MNFLQITHCDQVNGLGNRVVLWVSGCSHHCKGCQNAYSQNPSIGIKFTDNAKEEIFKDLNTEWCAGITFSGGDPLFIDNRNEIIALAKEIKEKFPAKNIWLYTGYTWSEIIEDPSMSEILKYVDILCDGEYVEELRDIERHWVGSSNQNVIDVKKRITQVSNIMTTM